MEKSWRQDDIIAREIKGEMTAKQMADHLLSLGYHTKKCRIPSIRTAMNRLFQKEILTRVSMGIYKLNDKPRSKFSKRIEFTYTVYECEGEELNQIILYAQGEVEFVTNHMTQDEPNELHKEIADYFDLPVI